MNKDVGKIVGIAIAIFGLAFLILIQNQSITSKKNEAVVNQSSEQNIYNYRNHSTNATDTIDPFGLKENEEETKANLGLPVPLEEVYVCNKEGERFATISKLIKEYCESSSNRNKDVGDLELSSDDYTLNSDIYVVEAIDTTYNYFKLSNDNRDAYAIFVVDELNLNYYITKTSKDEFDKVKNEDVDFSSYETTEIDSNSHNSLQQ